MRSGARALRTARARHRGAGGVLSPIAMEKSWPQAMALMFSWHSTCAKVLKCAKCSRQSPDLSVLLCAAEPEATIVRRAHGIDAARRQNQSVTRAGRDGGLLLPREDCLRRKLHTSSLNERQQPQRTSRKPASVPSWPSVPMPQPYTLPESACRAARVKQARPRALLDVRTTGEHGVRSAGHKAAWVGHGGAGVAVGC